MVSRFRDRDKRERNAPAGVFERGMFSICYVVFLTNEGIEEEEMGGGRDMGGRKRKEEEGQEIE